MKSAIELSSRLETSAWTALLALVVSVALVACSSDGSHAGAGGAPGRGVYVTSDWNVARRVTGHRSHVIDQHISCNRCHDLSATSVGAVSPARCAACHEARMGIEHAAHQAQARFGPGVKADCVNCHAFTTPDDPARPAGALDPYQPADCARCHAQAQGSLPAVTVHAAVACVNCHQPHRDRAPASADCAGCHGDIHTTHALAGKSPEAVCKTCHVQQHAPASAALATCVACHAKTQPLVPSTALFAGHTQCITCHQPHDFQAKEAVECRSCHKAVLVLAAARVPEHARCTSCHAPHDVRKSPAAACANCHWDVHSDHPERAGGCVSCHDPHPAPAQAQVVAKTCSSCHHAAANDHAFHGAAACTSCHQPHHFQVALAQHAVCQSCHQKELSLTATRTGHTACESCHAGLPHQPTPGGASCTACHADIRKQVRPGHRACVGCHEPHGGGVTAAPCKNCHAAEVASAPAGHRACVNCHEPHAGGASKAQCSSCHAAEAATPHGKLAVGCMGCHRAHGPSGVAKPPACVTCHAVAKLPGLHAQPQHQDCSRCHGGHGDAPSAARAACLSCHTDRSQHFPQAPRCANCHLFTSQSPGLKAR